MAGTYKRDILALLRAEAFEKFEEMKQNLQESWDPGFLAYFERSIQADLQKCGRWVIEDLGIYDPDSGITNNAAESANRLLKTIIREKRAGWYQGALAIYFLSNYHLNEYHRALESTGNWRVKDDMIDIAQSIPPLEEFQDVIDINVVESVVLHGKFPDDMPRVTEGPREESLTTIGIAKMLIKKKRITWDQEFGTFSVRGLFGKIHNVCKPYTLKR